MQTLFTESPELVCNATQVFILLKQQALKTGERCDTQGHPSRDGTNAEMRNVYLQQKRHAISRNTRGKVGENWALIVQQEQRGNWLRGGRGRPACPPEEVVSDSAGPG